MKLHWGEAIWVLFTYIRQKMKRQSDEEDVPLSDVLGTAEDALCARCLFQSSDSSLLSLCEFLLLASCALDVLLSGHGPAVRFCHM